MLHKMLAMCLICALARTAHGAHPLVTDDTFTQDRGNSQIEINADNVKLKDRSVNIGALTYSYGARPDLDVIANFPATFSSPSGINDASLGVKWRFFESGAASLALKPELLMPTGDQNSGMGNGRPSLIMTAIGSYDAAPWLLHGNLGVTLNRYALQAERDTNRGTVLRISAAAWYVLNERWKLIADTGAAQSFLKTEHAYPGFFMTGVIYSPAKHIDLDIGMRFGIGCRQCQTSIDRQLGVGLTTRF